MMPAAWIRKFNVPARPPGPLLGTPDIGGDRSNYDDHDSWTKLLQYPGQTNFAVEASSFALLGKQAIDRLPTQID
jgi:hypothetical protein